MSGCSLPKHVALVTNFYPPYVVGGAELVAASLARGLAARGVKTTVITTCARGDERTEDEDSTRDGTRVVRMFPRNLWWNYDRFKLGDRRGATARAAWNLRDQWNMDAFHRVGRILDEIRPDVVHTHNLKGFSPAVWNAAGGRQLPVVHTAHDFYLVCNRGVMLRDGKPCADRCTPCRVAGAWRKYSARHMTRLCAPSRFLLNRHLAAGLDGTAGHGVVPNGVSAPTNPPRVRKAESGHPLRLLFLGQVRAEKGAGLLPAIMAALPGIRSTIDIAGKGDLTEALCKASQSDQRIHMHGFVSGDDKEALLQSADLLVFPSVWPENAPLSIAEALANGLPVLASDLGGVPEFVRDGVSGLLAPPGDIGAFAAAIGRLVKEPGLLPALSVGAAAAGRALGESGMCDAYLSIYAASAQARATARKLTEAA